MKRSGKRRRSEKQAERKQSEAKRNRKRSEKRDDNPAKRLSKPARSAWAVLGVLPAPDPPQTLPQALPWTPGPLSVHAITLGSSKEINDFQCPPSTPHGPPQGLARDLPGPPKEPLRAHGNSQEPPRDPHGIARDPQDAPGTPTVQTACARTID